MSIINIPIDIHKYIIKKFLDKNSLYSYSRSCKFLLNILGNCKFGKKFALEHKQFNLIKYFKPRDILIINGNIQIYKFNVKYILIDYNSKMTFSDIKTKGIYLTSTSWINETSNKISNFKYCKILF